MNDEWKWLAVDEEIEGRSQMIDDGCFDENGCVVCPDCRSERLWHNEETEDEDYRIDRLEAYLCQECGNLFYLKLASTPPD